MKEIVLYFFILILMKANCLNQPNYAYECMAELGVSWSQMEEFEKSNPPHNIKCLSLCMGEKSGYITNKQINETAVLEELPSGVSIDFEQCKDITGIDDCDEFFKILECIREQFAKSMDDLKKT
uniref:Odorant binding protein 10 n=1 Tax=Holotrichia oblita TaxID=644536 RepID=A0A3Q8SSW4_HOLOL|nr:odorant binding protein 10 [Holotrichia oblita]